MHLRIEIEYVSSARMKVGRVQANTLESTERVIEKPEKYKQPLALQSKSTGKQFSQCNITPVSYSISSLWIIDISWFNFFNTENIFIIF